ncbi:hypothetical protein MKZ38_003898 [Zalerion maritima]|uniref:Uncharacterized protein n=1 Tax=Zalerion maritima TaxID=339359 RepID=A0AAD5RY83_9PEZI|nr:hypothetical protein MKZ38_003898 [Zalerion maritima]
MPAGARLDMLARTPTSESAPTPDGQHPLGNFRRSYPHLSQFLYCLCWNADGKPVPPIHPSIIALLAANHQDQGLVCAVQNEFVAQVSVHLQVPGLDFLHDEALKPMARMLNNILGEQWCGMEHPSGYGVVWRYAPDNLPPPLDRIDYPRCNDMVLDAMLQVSMHPLLFNRNECPPELSLWAPVNTDPVAREAQARRVIETIEEAYLLGFIQSPGGQKAVAEQRQYVEPSAPGCITPRVPPPPYLSPPSSQSTSSSPTDTLTAACLAESGSYSTGNTGSGEEEEAVGGFGNRQVLHRLTMELSNLRREVTALVNADTTEAEGCGLYGTERGEEVTDEASLGQEDASEYPDPDGLAFADLVNF